MLIFLASNIKNILFITILLTFGLLGSPVSYGQENSDSNEEPLEIQTSVPRSANAEPAGSITSLLSSFRYDPQVDLQQRNMAEVQSDITIRGGIFNMSGINIGAASIYDPQTSHYTGDIPLPPAFLSSASVITGVDNALGGFNANSGSIYSGFSPAENWNTARIGVGDFATNIQEVNTDSAKVLEGDLGALAIATNFSHSSSNGTEPDGDSELFRYAGRAQLSREDHSQTDLIYSYQSKNYKWPYLYAPQQPHDLEDSSGVEGNSLDTALVLLNHRTKISKTGQFEFTGYYKRTHDDSKFDSLNSDEFTPERNTTKVFGGGIQGLEYFDSTYVGVNAQIYGDNIDSNSLSYGNYTSRTLAKISAYSGRQLNVGNGLILEPTLGATWDKSDRTSEEINPVGHFEISQRCKESQNSIYLEYSGSSQLPNYSALNANPDQGLFRGNKSLKRTHSDNSEVGYKYEQEEFFLNTSVFYRKDKNLNDWIYTDEIESYTTRSADNIDVSTLGTELFAAVSKGIVTFASSYALLDKHKGDHLPDDSQAFYTSNYPSHRITSLLIAKPTDDFEFRGDIEFRKQTYDSLSDSSDSTYIISSLSATYEIEQITGLNLGVIIDNMGNEHFEEIPGVPGTGRIASFVANYVW